MDPYKVLGVSSSASDDEIKAAYRKLVKKYHPDRYTDSALREQAAEKIKEINAAYAEIERIRSGKGASTGGYGGASYEHYTSYSNNPKYNVVRARINSGDLNGAEALLDAMQEQDAEWHYLKGIILLRKGWQDGARQHFAMAYNMQPGNREYARAYQSINQMGGFRNFYGNTADSDCSACDVCTGMMLLDLCCGRRCC
jgi:molecular chaperone DnaJ